MANTNFIKVSDWLTTIIIGLTLINLGKVVTSASRLGAVLAEPLGGSSAAGTTGVALVIIGFTASLIFTFLWTTVRLKDLLENAEIGLVEGEAAPQGVVGDAPSPAPPAGEGDVVHRSRERNMLLVFFPLTGALIGWPLTQMLIAVLTGVFDRRRLGRRFLRLSRRGVGVTLDSARAGRAASIIHGRLPSQPVVSRPAASSPPPA